MTQAQSGSFLWKFFRHTKLEFLQPVNLISNNNRIKIYSLIFNMLWHFKNQSWARLIIISTKYQSFCYLQLSNNFWSQKYNKKIQNHGQLRISNKILHIFSLFCKKILIWEYCIEIQKYRLQVYNNFIINLKNQTSSKMRHDMSDQFVEWQFKGQQQMFAKQKGRKFKCLVAIVVILVITGNLYYARSKASLQQNQVSLKENSLKLSTLPAIETKSSKELINHITVKQIKNSQIFKRVLHKNNEYAKELQQAYYQQKYKLNTIKELPICVFVNVEKTENLQFLFKSLNNQKYTNYRVLLVDDSEKHGLQKQYDGFKKKNSINDGKFTIKTNQKPQGFIANSLYAAKSFCKPNQILVEYTQNAYMLGVKVLQVFNYFFHQNQVWFAYGNGFKQDGNLAQIGEYPSDIIQNSNFRQYNFLLGNIIAYAPQFVNYIRLQDLKNSNGQNFKVSQRVAFYMTMLELARKKVKYIPEILENQSKDAAYPTIAESQQEIKQIRMKTPYKAIGSIRVPSY